MATEYLMTLNKFDRPKVYVDKEGLPGATATLITRLILMNPGTIQTHPKMGVGLVARYRYTNSEDIRILEADIKEQVRTYLPNLYDASVAVTETDRIIHISIDSGDLHYIADYDKQTMTLSEL